MSLAKMSTIGTALSVCLILKMSVYLFLLAPFFGQKERKTERDRDRETSFFSRRR